jgi:hypothetical protein
MLFRFGRSDRRGRCCPFLHSESESHGFIHLLGPLRRAVPQTDTKNTPVSLESQHVPFDLETQEVSALDQKRNLKTPVDYLNDLSIDSPLRRTVDSPNRAPDPSGALASACDMTAATPRPYVLYRCGHLLSAQTLHDRLYQTSSSGMKPTFKDFKSLERATPRQTMPWEVRARTVAHSRLSEQHRQSSRRQAKRPNATILTTVMS